MKFLIVWGKEQEILEKAIKKLVKEKKIKNYKRIEIGKS